MTIKQQGGVFGRNPSFNDVEANTGEFGSISAGTGQFDTSLNVDGRVTSDGITVNGLYGDIYDLQGYQLKIDARSYGANPILELDHDLFGSGYVRIMAQRSSGNLEFYTGGQLRQEIRSSDGRMYMFTGNLAFANGLGIDFSATSGTGTSELFDDYEEGTWTPTGCGAGAVGVYTKMGDTVFAYCEVKANSVSTDTIGGLPFTVGAGNSAIGGYFGRARFAGIFDANGNEVRIRMLGTEIKFMNNGGLAGDAAATITTAAGGIVQLAISVIYKV